MRSLFFVFYFVFLGFNLHSQVNYSRFSEKFDLQKVKHLSLKKKYYLVAKEDAVFNKKTVIVVKKIDKKHFIITSKDKKKKYSFKGELFELNNKWKLSSKINSLSRKSKKRVEVIVKTIDPDGFLKELNRSNLNIRIIREYKGVFVLETSEREIDKIANIFESSFIDILDTPREEAVPLEKIDLTVNNVTKIHNEYADANGNNVNVSIKELLFDVEDIDLRNRIMLFGNENMTEESSSHATTMGTIIGGAGNSSYNSKGVAYESNLSSSDFITLLPDEDALYKNNSVYIQNHSYGIEIESFYGIQANAYDQSAVDVPELLHVFSSGNLGEQTPEEGSYEGVPGYANITGNFKMAKNVLVVGGVDEKLNLISRSSKGPTYDGRIKPELVAHAPNGTSDAAALVSGIAALLQQKYKEKNGVIPSSEVIKSLLIAGSDDVGTKGIDFKSGYGNVNAYESFQILENNNFINDVISNGETKEYSIPVNSLNKKIKIALVWNDVPANVDDHKALINDLDLELSKDTNVWLPWVLDNSPSKELLEKEATRGKDHINNVEFITVEHPQEGTYTLKVIGNSITTTNQSFSIAYGYEEDKTFVWNYPKMNDKLPTNLNKYLRWTNTLGKPINKIEYSFNDIDWIEVENSTNISSTYLLWDIPEFNGNVKLRALIDGVYYNSEEFMISNIVIPKVDFNCEDDIQFSWSVVPNATAYEVELIEDKFLYRYSTVDDTVISIPKGMFKIPYIAVNPIFNGREGIKGQTINYELQGINCYYKNFLAFLKNKEVVEVRLNLSTLSNVSSVVFEKNINGNVEVVQTFVTPITEELVAEDMSVSGGENKYRARIFLNDGKEILTDDIIIDLPFDNTLIIYPNPVIASQGMLVYSKGNNLELQIVDVTGRVFYTERVNKIRKTIPLEGIKSGLFFVRLIKEGKQIAVKKVVIKP